MRSIKITRWASSWTIAAGSRSVVLRSRCGRAAATGKSPGQSSLSYCSMHTSLWFTYFVYILWRNILICAVIKNNRHTSLRNALKCIEFSYTSSDMARGIFCWINVPSFERWQTSDDVASQVVQFTAWSSAALSQSGRHSRHQTALRRMVSNWVSVLRVLVKCCGAHIWSAMHV